MKKLNLSGRVMATLVILALMVALIPLYRLTFFAFPKYDDFSYGKNLALMVRYGLGPRCLWEAGYSTVMHFHYAWQGTYSSVFMMALMPGAIDLNLYWIGPAVVITSITLGTLTMCYTLCRCFLKAGRADALTASGLATIAVIEFIHTAQQGFYWYNSAVHYTFMHGMLYFLVAVMVRFYFTEKKWAKILLFLCAIALSFVCAGANFVTALQGLMLIFGWGVICGIRKKTYFIPFAGMAAFYGYWLYYSLSSPGNDARAASYTGCSAPESILRSFQTAFQNLWKFTGWNMLIVALVLAPVLIAMVRNTKFRFPLPIFVLVLSFCFYASGWVSSFYGMGAAVVSRTWVPIRFNYQILFFVNEAYLLGYFLHRRELFAKWPEKVKRVLRLLTGHFIPYYAVLGILMVVWFLGLQDPIGSVSSYGAYLYWHSGEAYNVHEEFLERVDTILSSGPDVVVEKYSYMPWFLVGKDISTDPGDEECRIMASYFGKDSICRRAD